MAHKKKPTDKSASKKRTPATKSKPKTNIQTGSKGSPRSTTKTVSAQNKKKKPTSATKQKSDAVTTNNGNLVDLNKVRQSRSEGDRRHAERHLLGQFLRVYCFVEDLEIPATDISLDEVSPTGLAFLTQDPELPIQLPKGSEIKMRLYLSRDTFLPIWIQIMHISPYIENGQRHFRFGCRLLSEFSSHDAYRNFVKFVESYIRTCRMESTRRQSPPAA